MKLQIADVADLEVQVNKYKWQNYTEEELKSLAITSSLKNFCEKLGYTAYRSIIKKQIIKEYPDLEQIFRDNKIKYRHQHSFTDLKKIRPLKFDFAIFDNKDTLKYVIEYQGQQHYEPVKYFGRKDSFVKQQKYDEEKRKYYKENNIQLIEMPYWDFAKINLNYLKEKMGVYYGKIKN